MKISRYALDNTREVIVTVSEEGRKIKIAMKLNNRSFEKRYRFLEDSLYGGERLAWALSPYTIKAKNFKEKFEGNKVCGALIELKEGSEETLKELDM